jgi:ATP-dependent DNA helicase RecQ
MSSDALHILKSIFGYETFRPLQQDIIQHVLNHQDTLVVMPTGGGKSLCYQIPALLMEGLTIVISPLISLMKDQVEQLQQLGVQAAFLNSSLSPEETQRVTRKLQEKKIKLLYMAPEGLLTARNMAMLRAVPVVCITIDEAHCISEWGHDFRPEYRKLVAVRNQFPQAVIMALTATATPRVRQDIRETLAFASNNEFIAGFDRKNLFLEICEKVEPGRQLVDFLRAHRDQSGIIYCFSRKQVDELAQYLQSMGFSVLPYHAGLEDQVRTKNQEQFVRDDVQIMVATVAFGMGINKPNVRFVMHYDVPRNIESYYQEIGRAGRDGLRADCLMLFSYADLAKIRYLIDQKPEEKERRIAHIHLQALVQMVESPQCRRASLLPYFGEAWQESDCGMCDNCLGDKPELHDVTVAAQKFLSCVKRTGEMFGSHHIIDVLRGSENSKVLDFGHHHLTTYGIGKELSREEWLHLSRQLLALGLLKKTLPHGSLKLTMRAEAVLYKGEKVKATVQKAGLTQAPAVSVNYDQALFDLLRRKRKELADEQNIPPYAVFPDRTLFEMARSFPRTMDSLRIVYGVGEVKAKHYGALFLQWIETFCQEHQIEEKPSLPPPLKKVLRHEVIGQAFCEGKSIAEMEQIFMIKPTTLVDHLNRYHFEGNPLPAELLRREITLPIKEFSDAMTAFSQLGTQQLRPVFDHFQGRLTFHQLHLLRLYFLAQNDSNVENR